MPGIQTRAYKRVALTTTNTPRNEAPTFFFMVYCKLHDQDLITNYMPPWGMSRVENTGAYVELMCAVKGNRGPPSQRLSTCPPWTNYPSSSFACLEQGRDVPGGRIVATEVFPQPSASAVFMPISTAVGLPGGKAQALTSRTISLHGAEPLTASSAPELAGYACNSALGSGVQPCSAKVVFDIEADDGVAYIRTMTQTMNTWAPDLVQRQHVIKIQQDARRQAKADNLAQKRTLFFTPKNYK
jgi:hypothetical protein